jgi:Zn-dependent M28 family amino/carboxypeptidase
VVVVVVTWDVEVLEADGVLAPGAKGAAEDVPLAGASVTVGWAVAPKESNNTSARARAAIWVFMEPCSPTP